MFRRQRGFVRGCSWYIHFNGGDTFQIIIFDIIDSIFKYWFWFEFFCFKPIFDTKRIKILVKGCDIWWIHGSGGNNFQMIIFDLINILFKCWIRFEFFCLKAVVHTKLIKILVKGCSNFSNNKLWCNLYWYFFYPFSSFLYACFFLVESNQFFFNMFWLLILLFYEIYQLFFWLLKKLSSLLNLAWTWVSNQSS